MRVNTPTNPRAENVIAAFFANITAFSVLTLIAWAAAAQDEDLILYYDFESFDGNAAVDRSAYGRDGAVEGNVQPDAHPERDSGAALFEPGSYIDLDGENWPAELIPREGMTVAAWINVKAIADQAIFNARAGDGAWLVHPEVRGEGNFRWLLRGDGGASIFDIRAGAAKADEWTHYAGTYDGSTGNLYINGERVGSQNANGLIAKDWGMGARVGYNIDNNRPFNGHMDDLNLWKRGLTQEEVETVMAFGPLPQNVSPKSNAAALWGNLKRQ